MTDAACVEACAVHRAAPVAVTRRVDRVDPDWACDPRALAAAQDAAQDTAKQPVQDAAPDTTEPAAPDVLGPPVDDFDEATEADAFAADEEPTTVRPTPIPPGLMPGEAADVHDTSRARPARSRGRVGKYQLSTRLARGAFGVVYTAHDPSLERNVAIKVLRPTHLDNQEIVQRFLQEARATARVAHPGIVTIHDCGMVETRRGVTAFIAMELLSGESLSRRLARQGRLSPAAACEIVRQVASALEAAHHVDVLHRDLKPDNIFLVPDPAMPSGERVKVLDFGLAKLGARGHTQLQMVFGTPRYMSPEQSRSATQIDRRSDIYSLGCILFELVTGRTPFDGDARQLIERHQRMAPPRAAALDPEVPAVLDELIADMLAKDPKDRPQTMGAVQRVLRFAVDGGPDEGPTMPEDPPPLVLSLLARPSPSMAGLAAATAATRPPSSPFAPSRPPSSPPPSSRPPSSPPPSSRPPSSPPPSSRPPSSPPPAGPPPAGLSSPGGALASVEISMSSCPSLRAIEPAPPAAGDSGVSGEIVVPAAAARDAERSVEAAPVAWPEAPDRRHQLVFYLCVVTIAVITAAALAVG
jgi:eukaryotic-like serine/threonine-protein kinase